MGKAPDLCKNSTMLGYKIRRRNPFKDSALLFRYTHTHTHTHTKARLLVRHSAAQFPTVTVGYLSTAYLNISVVTIIH